MVVELNIGPHPQARTSDAIVAFKKGIKIKIYKDPMQVNTIGRVKR